MDRRAAAIVVGALALSLGGCLGSGGDKPRNDPSPGPAPIPQESGDARVIREWSDLLRHGRVEDASALFGVPAVVANGTPPVQLGSRAEVDAFNESLPCGARLLTTVRQAPYTVATFRLTGRPGGDCGPGAGEKAATAFRIKKGHIVEWLRVPVPREQPRPEPQV